MLFKKNVFFLHLIFVFVYSFCCVYSFTFCIFCIVKMQESSRQGSLLPPFPLVPVGVGGGRFPSYTSLDLTPSTTCAGPHVAGGWEGAGGIPGKIVPSEEHCSKKVSLPPTE